MFVPEDQKVRICLLNSRQQIGRTDKHWKLANVKIEFILMIDWDI